MRCCGVVVQVAPGHNDDVCGQVGRKHANAVLKSIKESWSARNVMAAYRMKYSYRCGAGDHHFLPPLELGRKVAGLVAGTGDLLVHGPSRQGLCHSWTNR